MENSSILIPRPAAPDKPYRSPDEHWERVTKAMYGSIEEVQNIRHVRDVHWRERLVSVQSAHDQYTFKAFGFWTFVSAFFFFAGAGLMMGFVRGLRMIR